MSLVNPYEIPPGAELDRLIHQRIFEGKSSPEPLSYSTNGKLADKVRIKVKVLYGHRVVSGETRLHQRPYFARFESDPSTSTEVLAETYPLAVCRLALLLSERHHQK